MDSSNIVKRTIAVQQVLQEHDSAAVKSFVKHLDLASGNLERALSSWDDDPEVSLPADKKKDLLGELRLTTNLAAISNDDVKFVQAARTQHADVKTLREFAISCSLSDIASMTESGSSHPATLQPNGTAGVTPSTSGSSSLAAKSAISIRRNLFLAEPTGVVMRMLKDNEIRLDPGTQDHVYNLLAENSNFDIGKTPVSSLLSKSTLFQNIPDDTKTKDAVQSNLRTLMRVQALSPIPESISPLMKNKLTSALSISNLSEAAFVKQLANEIGDRDAVISIHRHAVKSRIRNENFLVSSIQAVRGSGLRVIDGGNSRANFELRKASFSAAASQAVTQVDLEQLFGSLDFCECSDCGSVYSPASYFVELMEFLRNDNLNVKNSKSGAKDINGTQLQALLKRRPDLACLQLTCENTNTLIPYIDLALEVMESYVVHAPMITAYNVNGETSNELLCSPQHTNLAAYEILRTAVFPLGLPFHLPIDTMRVFLQFLKTSRAEIIRVFQPGGVLNVSAPTSSTVMTVSRSYDAEFNLLTQEEYVILTKQSFSSRSKGKKSSHQLKSEAKKIGLQQPWEYFGYNSEKLMLDDDPTTKAGLSWVKAQFVKRTGIQYTDLVDLLQTRYINPNMPTGKALATMERIKFSYRFLQYLVQKQYKDKRRRFARLIQFLELADEILPAIEQLEKSRDIDLCADPNSIDCPCVEVKPPPSKQCCCNRDEWVNWVYDWFVKIGSIIVLESGEGPRIPLEGRVWAERPNEQNETQLSPSVSRTQGVTSSNTSSTNSTLIGTLKSDGALIDDKQDAIAFVSASGSIVDLSGKNLQESYPNQLITIYAQDSDVGDISLRLGRVSGDFSTLYYRPPGTRRFLPIKWTEARDDCDITQTRLLHLDGSQLSADEYFSMERFLRLWRKLGWTMSEVDQAIIGLGKQAPAPEGSDQDSTSSDSDSNSSSTGASTAVISTAGSSTSKADITPTLIHQLVAVKRLLDITGLSLEIVLTFWDLIPTHGNDSLYASTFLTHNIIRMDPVFQPDANGNFLTTSEKISDHMPVLQATMRLKATDIELVRQLRAIPDSLTMETLSELFRISTLVRYLSIRADVLGDVLTVLGEPFTNADATLLFVETWQKISNSNFSFQQLNYLIRGVDNLSNPLAPTQQAVLKLGKSLLDGLTAILTQNADVSEADVENKTVSLTDLIPAKLALVFDPTLATRINNLINGRMVFTTNAPPGIGITIPAALTSLAAKVKYNDQSAAKPPTAQLVVTGILTDEEAMDLKGLSANAMWSTAVDRIKKQGITFYNQYLASIFPADGQTTLLAGDTADTPTTKGLYFLKSFMPFLRARLSSAMVQQTMSDTLGTDPATTSYLLNIVKSSSGSSALDVLLALKDNSQSAATNIWSGYLIPMTTDKFQFWVTSDAKPSDLVINGLTYGFPNQSEDPTNIWSSDSNISLVGGTLYKLQLSGITPDGLSWSTSTSPPALIPSSSLLPDVASSSVSEVLVSLTKISILMQGFNMSLDEVTYFHDHGDDFASLTDKTALDLGKVSIGTWERLFSYTALRDSLPKQPTRLVDLFAWSRLPNSTDVVVEIVKATRWDSDACTAILTGYNALKPENFHNELVLISLKKALEITTKTEIATTMLFDWAKPLSLSDASYNKLVAQADLLKNTLKSRYSASDWEQAGKSLFDTLRRDQRDALVSYLVVEPSLVATGMIQDADSLFEYFLIDCQMSSCLQTSRIKQAISTIQLYVQRCLLGLEVEVGQQPDDLIDRARWNWVKRYRVWEANRQVYLYPENWIVPSLRDDKTPIFLDLESSLQQKDISLTSAAASLKTYILNVAAVANLKVFGLFAQKANPTDTAFGVHIVARRMNAPFDWYSRDYSVDGTWSPWIKMQVDIPNYDVDDANGNPVGSGSYVAPYVWQGRPIIFFMQLALKQITKDNAAALSARFNLDGKAQNQNIPLWQINLGVSRYDSGKWTPKELSQSSLRHIADGIDVQDHGVTVTIYPTPNLARYQMVPRFIAGQTGAPDHIQIDIVYTADEVVSYDTDVPGHPGTTVGVTTSENIHKVIGSFVFVDGGIAQQVNVGSAPAVNFTQTTSFHYLESSNTIYTYQIDDGTATPKYFQSDPSVSYPADPTSGGTSQFTVSTANSVNFVFNHTFVDPLLKLVNTSDDLGLIYSDFSTLSQAADTANADPFGTVKLSDGSTTYNEQMSPYGIYNWEIGLHAPMTLIDSLLNAQQFDDALTVCHTIFDPSIVGSAASSTGDNSQFWKFQPFKALANADAKESLETMFLSLAPGTPNPDISAWRDNPFAPHVVARMRPVAYMKWVAMKYIEILIAYGDYYFRQNSLETIPDAIQCYILASHVYGPRGQKIPRRGKTKPETYSSLLNRWDAFGNAIVQLEVEFPFSNQISQIVGTSNGISGFANIYGFASALYFCIPSNPQLSQLRDTIDDRLYKIRNCMDINGVVRQLPLFDPPIDPALLVAATAQGLSIDTVLNDLSGPVPNYRFQTLIAKALEICSELKSLGSALLAAREKKDGEHLSTLRAAHETILAGFALDMKNRALDEANAVLDQLLQNRVGPSYRLQFYKSLFGLTDGPPGEMDDFNEIPNTSLETPSADGQLMIISEESEEINKASASRDWAIGIGSVETLAGVLHMWPDTDIDVKPFGVGTGLKWGGTFLGGATGAVARGMQVYATTLTNDSTAAGRKAGLLRALQDRVFQANNSGHELKNVDKQITVQRLRVASSTQEIQNATTALAQAGEVEQYLRTKYTNEELYAWMESRTRALYNDTYGLAYDLAKRAEKTFQFERPQLATASYIEMGYFSSARDGLLAGEALYLGLKRLESAWQADLGHDFELVKHISVRQWAPLALVQFREQGNFVLDVPEILFDMDCPGHYMRRIVSVNVSIPCVAGPYAGINCTLRLQQHSMRTTPRASGTQDYPRASSDDSSQDQGENRFTTTNLPITAVVLSSAQADSGRFDAPPDRYNPFEGAGAISTWSFSLPTAMHSFDYSSIADVIVSMRYTALDGGDKLRDIASGVVGDYVKTMLDAGAPDGKGLFTFFDLRTDFASEWYRAAFGTTPADPSAVATMNLDNVSLRLPLYAASTLPEKTIATRVALLARGSSFAAGDVMLTQKMAKPSQTGQSVTFKDDKGIDPLTGIVSADDALQLPMTSWLLTVKQGSMDLTGLWMVVRYSLKP